MINSIDWIAPGGDSIGAGTAEAAGIPHSCLKDREPHQVLAVIRATPAGLIRDRNVLLSCGISNNPDGRAFVEPQLSELLARGARSIMIIGVGPGNDKVNLTGVNEWLRQVASYEVYDDRVRFAGPLAPPWVTVWQTGDQPGIHPVFYSEVVDQINAVLAG